MQSLQALVPLLLLLLLAGQLLLLLQWRQEARQAGEGEGQGEGEGAAAVLEAGVDAQEGQASAWTVLLLAVASAVAGGVGGLPFLLAQWWGVWQGGEGATGTATTTPSMAAVGARCSACAAGLMLGAVAVLAAAGGSVGLEAAGAVGGAAVVWGAGGLGEGVGLGMGGEGARFVLAMGLHSVAEGVALGVAFGGGRVAGTCVALALAIHNVPEGLAIALVLLPRGSSPLHAVLWAFVASLPQPLMAMPAFYFVELFHALLPLGLGFAAGAMALIVATDLLPEALDGTIGRREACAWIAGCFVAMCLFQALLEHLLQ